MSPLITKIPFIKLLKKKPKITKSYKKKTKIIKNNNKN
jgi:hypothetical protein